jgi:hypothetical protein
MDATTSIAFAGLVLGGLGTAGSIYSIVRQVRRDRAEERRLSRADLTARYEQDERNYYIVVENRGSAPAMDVKVSFGVGSGQTVLGLDDQDVFETDILDSGQSVRFQWALTIGADASARVVLEWKDGDGPHDKELPVFW